MGDVSIVEDVTDVSIDDTNDVAVSVAEGGCSLTLSDTDVTINLSEDVTDVGPDSGTISISVLENVTDVSLGGVFSLTPIHTNSVEILGSDFDGTNATTGRSYVHSGALTSTMLVFLEGVLAKTSQYSLSTTTITNDTITLTPVLFDSDEVTLLI